MLTAVNAQAQLRKCVAPNGKVTYSDVVCDSGSTAATVRNADGNTVDTSGMRQQAEISQQRVDRTIAMQNPPSECRFRSYKFNDEKGKALADSAQRECIENLLATKQGKPTSKEAYTLWKDHHELTTATREAAHNRAVSTLNADNIARSNERAIQGAVKSAEQRELTCKPNLMRTALECKPP